MTINATHKRASSHTYSLPHVGSANGVDAAAACKACCQQQRGFVLSASFFPRTWVPMSACLLGARTGRPTRRPVNAAAEWRASFGAPFVPPCRGARPTHGGSPSRIGGATARSASRSQTSHDAGDWRAMSLLTSSPSPISFFFLSCNEVVVKVDCPHEWAMHVLRLMARAESAFAEKTGPG